MFLYFTSHENSNSVWKTLTGTWNVLLIYSVTCGLSLECSSLVRCDTLKENWPFLSYQFSFANGSSIEIRFTAISALQVVIFVWLELAQIFVHTITTAVSSYVQVPCCVQKCIVAVIYHHRLLQSFCPFLYNDPWALLRRRDLWYRCPI